MKCHFCENIATEKHHIRYYPEETIAVCSYHGDQIHIYPFLYQEYIKYQKGDSTAFYAQRKRIERFFVRIAKSRRQEKRR